MGKTSWMILLKMVRKPGLQLTFSSEESPDVGENMESNISCLSSADRGVQNSSVIVPEHSRTKPAEP